MHVAQKDRRRKTVGAGIDVALTALRQRRDMVDLLALRDNAVMTGRAVVAHAQMVEGAAAKVIELKNMTVGTVARGLHVVRALALADISVVAGRAVAANTGVVENRPGKVIEFDDMTIGAILVVGRGRYVIGGLTGSDHIVVTRRATVDDAVVIIPTRSKGARCVTHMAIIRGWHVVGRFAESRTTVAMTLSTIVHINLIGTMVEDTDGEIATADAMTDTAIFVRRYMVGLRTLAARTDTIIVVVAGRARLHAGVDQTVIVNAAHTEARGAMADCAIHGHDRMAYGLIRRAKPATACIVAGVAAFTHDIGAAVIRIRI